MKNCIFLLCTFLCIFTLSSCGSSPSETTAADSLESAASAEPSAGYRESMMEYGRLERLRMDIPSDAAIAVQGTSFSISAQELDALAQQYQLSSGYDETTAREKAYALLVEKYALYAYAAAQGYSISDQLLDSMISDMQDSDETNPQDFKAFIKGFGNDEELYWFFYKEDLRIYETINAFRDAERAVYPGSDTEYGAYYSNLVDTIISQENIVWIEKE